MAHHPLQVAPFQMIELRRVPGDESGNLPTGLSDIRNHASTGTRAAGINRNRIAPQCVEVEELHVRWPIPLTLAAVSAVNPERAMSVTRDRFRR